MSTGYRPPSREPKGRWARHIHASRRAKGWSQTHGFEAVQKAGLGLGEKSRSAYIAIDMGDRQPTPDEERVLLKVYGAPPETEPEPEPVADMAGLIRALDKQTTAINALVSQLESLAVGAIRDGVKEALAQIQEAEGHQTAGGSQSERLLAPLV